LIVTGFPGAACSVIRVTGPLVKACVAASQV
jgi:hypothetical protein